MKKVQSRDKVYVAMSSGVDSSTVAALLARCFGRDRVHGVFMNNWSLESKCLEKDWRQVQDVAKIIGIDCHQIDLERSYWTDVFSPMVEGYRTGITPNPDVACNRHVKFGSLIQHLRKYDPDFKWLATGHYAGIEHGDVLSYLHRPLDRKKDQSYYLATVQQEALRNALFPLAGLHKTEVRKIAAELALPTAFKPDSVGLCFVEQSQKSFNRFLEDYVEPDPGLIETSDGRVVGEHCGLWTATIGQRASVAMPQGDPESRGSWYVCGKDVSRNRIIICRGTDNPLLYQDTIVCRLDRSPPESDTLYAQYRSLMEPVKVVRVEGNVIYLAESRRAIAPGQYLVLYNNDVVVASGIIEKAITQNSKDPTYPNFIAYAV